MLRRTILIDWFLKRYEIWNLWNVITNLKWIYRIIFWGQNEKIGHDISDLLRPNCPLDRLTNDNNSKIKPDNTNKIFAVRSTIFQDSSFVCQAKIICNLLFEQKIIENLLFRANTEIEIADLFFFLGWKTSKWLTSLCFFEIMPTIGKFLFDKLLVWSKIGISKVCLLSSRVSAGLILPRAKTTFLVRFFSMMMLMMFDGDGNGEYEGDDHIQRCDFIQISNEGTFKRTSRLQMGIWIWYNWYMQ